MDDLLSDFLTETTESLGEADVALVRLERTPDDAATLGLIFRLVHTIKGTCGFLGLPRLERAAHSAENVLGKVRDGVLAVTPDVITQVLAGVDRIKLIVAGLAATEAEPVGDDTALIAALDRVASGQSAAPVPAAPEPTPNALQEIAPSTIFAGLPPIELPAEHVEQSPAEPVLAAPTPVVPAPVVPAPVVPAPVVLAPVTPSPISQTPIAKTVAAPVAAAPTEPAPADTATADTSLAQQTIRVTVDVLEDLMTLVSELVLTRNQLLQLARTQENGTFAVPLQRLSHITSDLQEGVMKTRMQPTAMPGTSCHASSATCPAI